jgi:hypothetical protein
MIILYTPLGYSLRVCIQTLASLDSKHFVNGQISFHLGNSCTDDIDVDKAVIQFSASVSDSLRRQVGDVDDVDADHFRFDHFPMRRNVTVERHQGLGRRPVQSSSCLLASATVRQTMLRNNITD